VARASARTSRSHRNFTVRPFPSLVVQNE
jgi:hypothetical protein